MKKSIILITLFSTLLFSINLNQNDIVLMVKKIKEERVGISLLKLKNTSNPFPIREKQKVVLKEEVEEVTKQVVYVAEKVYLLNGILNDAAFINNKWYKRGSKIDEYKVGYISDTSVILKSLNGNKTLSLKKKNKKLIKLNQGYR